MAGFSRSAVAARLLETKYVNGKYTPGRGAFEVTDTVEFRIYVPESTVGAELLAISDDTGERFRFSMTSGSENYSVSIPMAQLCAGKKSGLFFYKYRVYTAFGTFDMMRREHDFSECYVNADNKKGDFQLLVYEKRKYPPEWLYGGVMYQIFPDRFFSAGENPVKNGAVLCRDRDEFPSHFRDRLENEKNNVFFGGDLQGIVKKLDYLVSLGVTCLYLNPIFESPSNHRYDTADYRTVDQMLGGDAALQMLVEEADKRGIAVLLDGVFNHTGSDSIYFNAKGTYDSVGAAQSKDSPYYPWYTFERYPDRYDAWWGVRTLPRVKSDCPTYREFLFGKDGIIRRYMKFGIAGWRIDVADELSDAFLSELFSVVSEEKRDAAVIGEVWEDATDKYAYGVRKKYLQGGELDSVMNYPVRRAVIEYLTVGNYMSLRGTLLTIYGHYPPEAANASMNILGTHDTERILTALGDEKIGELPYPVLAEHHMTDAERCQAKTRLRLAVCIQMTLPGVPCILYGDEAGMEGYIDPFCRGPFPWGEEDEEITALYRMFGKLRREEQLFRCADFSFVYADADLFCFERRGEKEMIVVLVNRSEETYEFRSSLPAEDLFRGVSDHVSEIGPASFALMKLPTDTDYNVFVKIGKEKPE